MAGGITAGRLSIEVMADVARLQADMDKIKRAVSAASGDIAKSAKSANDNLANLSSGMNRANNSAGAQRQGLQQLGYQLGDFSTQVSSGTSITQAFAQQIGQASQALQLMGGGSGALGKVATFLGGPFGIALTVALPLVAMFASRLFETEKAAKDSTKAQRSLVEVLNDSKSSWEEVTKAAQDYADQARENRQISIDQLKIEAQGIASRIKEAIATRELLRARLELAEQRMSDPGFGGALPGIQAARSSADIIAKMADNQKALNALIAASGESVIKVGDEIAKITSDPKYAIEARFERARHNARETIKTAAELAAELAKINKQEQAAQDALTESTRAKNKELKQTAVTMQEVAKALGLQMSQINSGLRTAEQQHREFLKGGTRADGYKIKSDHQVGQAIDIPLTINGRPLTKDSIRAMLEPLGIQIKQILGPGDPGHSDHFHIAFKLKRLTHDQVGDAQEDARKAAEKIAEAYQKVTDELAADMLKGWNDALGQAMERTRAILEGNTNVDWAEMLKGANDNLDKAQKPLKDAADAQAEWNDRLQETVGWLKQVGGVGGTLGSVLGAFQGLSTGDFSAVGGRAGAMLQSIAGIQWRDDTGQIRKLGEEFKGALTDVFGDGFGDKLIEVFQGAAIGATVGGIAFGGNQSAQTGATIGGAFGKAAFKEFAGEGLKKALGAFGGPLASLAGSIIGGLLGGLLKKAKTGSATIGIANGELGIGGVSGNSNSRKAASTQGANSVIDALNQIADAFGASLGTAGVSIGMRNSTYRVDTTGAGRTKGAGVLNFGKDSEAALKAAIADAISDGVFVGLSAGVERLLKNGDVEKQLQKALSFQAVFDDLANATDPAKAAQDAITKWADGMAKIFAEAGATADELAKLETLTGIKRADAAKAAAEAILEAERPRRELEVQIMELEGKSVEALAAARQLELDGMDAALRPLMERIHLLQTEADLAAKAAAITAQRHELELQLLEIIDPVAGALARQVDALNALDPSLRGAQQAVWDAKEAFDAAAQSAKDAADALKAAFEGVQAMVDQRRALTIQIAQLIDPLAAQELERADALRASAPANRELLQQYWSILDATTRATAAEKELADARDAAAKLAEQRRGLEIQLADVLNPAMAEAMRRADALAALTDPISRGLQEQIYAALDAKAAEAELAEARDKAAEASNALRDRMLDAYKREADGLQGIIDKMGGFAASIAQFRNGLLGQPAGIGMSGKAFASTASMARFGDEGALSRFTGDAQAYLDAARGGTEAQYRKALGEVLRGSNGAIGGAQSLASTAQAQLDRMTALVGVQETGNAAFETFASAYDAWQSSLAGQTIPAVTETVSAGLDTVAQAVTTSGQSTEQRLAGLEAAMIGMAGNIASINGYMRTAHRGDAFAVTAEDTLPVEVVA